MGTKFKKSFDKIISRPAPGLGPGLRSDKIIFLNYKNECQKICQTKRQ